MKITYIQHSSFCIEFEEEKQVLLFDYYEGKLPEWAKDSHVYVFASHKHFDHYSKKIFKLGTEYSNITFILAKEIKMNTKYMDKWDIPEEARDKIVYVTYDAKYKFLQNNLILENKEKRSVDMQSAITVDTLKSTDSGVAFIVKCAGKCIYHAGDLNWWTWIGETDKEYEVMTNSFEAEINKISVNTGCVFDIAFLPLDPRQKERFFWGFDYFLRKCNVKKAFPMHMWKDYSVIDKLLGMEESSEYRDKIMKVQKENQEYNIL